MRPSDLDDRVAAEVARLCRLDERTRVRAEPVLNYGGFVNRSFRVSTPGGVYHVKLTDTDDSRQRLERSYAVAEHLAHRYRCPNPRGWVRIPDMGFAGPLFDWIEGRRPAPPLTALLRRQVVDTVARLHADLELATELERLGSASRSCAEAYRDSYHERFVEDLAYVRENRPAFVSADLLEWLAGEVVDLARWVDESPAFDRPARRATHGDLWIDNLLVAGSGEEAGAGGKVASGELFILDWDEVGLGDPVMDWAMLFGPSRARVEPVNPEALAGIPLSDAERSRLRLFRRASMLDWIIDPLADWVAAADEPEHGAAVRRSNRRVHRQALRAYRDLWPEAAIGSANEP